MEGIHLQPLKIFNVDFYLEITFIGLIFTPVLRWSLKKNTRNVQKSKNKFWFKKEKKTDVTLSRSDGWQMAGASWKWHNRFAYLTIKKQPLNPTINNANLQCLIGVHESHVSLFDIFSSLSAHYISRGFLFLFFWLTTYHNHHCVVHIPWNVCVQLVVKVFAVFVCKWHIFFIPIIFLFTLTEIFLCRFNFFSWSLKNV